MIRKTFAFSLLLCTLLVSAFALVAQESPTHLKVFLKGKEAELIPIDEIDSLRFVKKECPRDQMPLINFDYNTDKAPVEAYEATLGRKLQKDVNVNNDKSEAPNLTPAYVNLSLDLIPIVSYGGTNAILESDVIIALCREPINDCPKVRGLITDLGFTETYKDETSYQYKKEDMSIVLQVWPNSKWGTKTCLTILRPTPPAPVAKAHDFVATAKDLPSIEALMSNQVDKIVAFEREAGYREIPSDLSGVCLSFPTKSDQTKKSNITFAFYWIEQHKVTGIFNAISSVEEALSSSQIHEWAKLNGFDGTWSKQLEHDELMDKDIVYATVSNAKATLRIFYERSRMKFEILPKKN